MTIEEKETLQKRLEMTLKELSIKPASFWWSDNVRQVRHIHLMDGEYDGVIVYLFPRWHHKYGSCNVFFDTRTGRIDGNIREITAREICNHEEAVTEYWETYFDSTRLS